MPQKHKTTRPRRRHFTHAEAERSLPLVRRIVGDVVEEYGKLTALIRHRNAQQERGNAEAIPECDRKAQDSVDRINELIEEVHAVGCDLKDWESGLVDFPAKHDGRTVYLCWRLGEDGITHWHEVHAGVAGRQPIDDDFRRDVNEQREPVGASADGGGAS